MGFSVDYRFTGGAPGTSNRYAWVILPARGKAVPLEVTLEPEGTLQTFVAALRPEHGPFRCFVAEVGTGGNLQAISATATLR